MKKSLALLFSLTLYFQAQAWWDPGHLVTAMIAYLQLDEQARGRVDELTGILQRDYPYLNHFITTGPWPDDLKAEEVRAYDTWHYTNIPYNWQGVALPPKPEIDVIWAISEAVSILESSRTRDIDKARFLGFLVHFVSDLHQPMHTTTQYDNRQPGGNAGGNGFTLQGQWRNLHALWDDGAGYLSAYNDINPYGTPKDALSEAEIARIRTLAEQLMRDYPSSKFPTVNELDPDFWALEGHQLAVRYGYRGVNGQNDQGRNVYLENGGTPSAYYLEQAQEVVRQRLALSGYRLGRLLNRLFGKNEQSPAEREVLSAVQQLFDAMAAGDAVQAEKILLPEASLYRVRIENGKSTGAMSSGKDFLKDLKKSGDQWIERFWDPVVTIQERIATVQAPYDFHRNGQFSHCGTDVFNLVKSAEGWKITCITYDVQTEGCAPSPLGPLKEKE